MKKWKILTPCLMGLCVSLPIGLTSCNSKYQNYQVSMDDFEKIVSMEGVQYVQFIQYIVSDNMTTFMQYEISPTVYHLNMFSDDPDMNQESYGYVQNETYWKIYRTHSTIVWSDPIEIDKQSFYTPQKIAETIKFHYHQALTCGSKVEFNNEDLNYQTSYIYETDISEQDTDAHWNFYKNQIKSFGYNSIVQEGGFIQHTEQNDLIDFKYEQYTPDLPQ